MKYAVSAQKNSILKTTMQDVIIWNNKWEVTMSSITEDPT
jgi:hypothetical protein